MYLSNHTGDLGVFLHNQFDGSFIFLEIMNFLDTGDFLKQVGS